MCCALCVSCVRCCVLRGCFFHLILLLLGFLLQFLVGSDTTKVTMTNGPGINRKRYHSEVHHVNSKNIQISIWMCVCGMRNIYVMCMQYHFLVHSRWTWNNLFFSIHSILCYQQYTALKWKPSIFNRCYYRFAHKQFHFSCISVSVALPLSLSFSLSSSLFISLYLFSTVCFIIWWIGAKALEHHIYGWLYALCALCVLMNILCIPTCNLWITSLKRQSHKHLCVKWS